MDIKDSVPTSLPTDQFEFQLNVKGTVTGKTFLGEFTFRIPNLKTQSQSSRHEASLNGDLAQYLPDGIKMLHQMLAYLKFNLVEVPAFWRKADFGHELRDSNVILEVFNKCMDFEREWSEQIWGKPEVEDHG